MRRDDRRSATADSTRAIAFVSFAAMARNAVVQISVSRGEAEDVLLFNAIIQLEITFSR